MEPIDVDAFEALVADALEAIPDELRAEMENVAIIIDDESPPGRALRAVRGDPAHAARHLRRGAPRPDHALPGHHLPVRPHARRVSQPGTGHVLHEVGHHFGLGEARLHELGWA